MNTSRFSRARLALLIGAALAVALIASLTLPPQSDSAEAQTERTLALWSATLTVDEASGYFGCDDSDPSHANCSTALTENEFSYAGVTFEIFELYIEPSGDLRIRLNNTWPLDIAQRAHLNLDSGRFRLSNSLFVNTATREWPNAGLSWTDGQQVAVSLTMPLSQTQLRTYGWCFDRLSEQACADAIGRWEALTRSVTLIGSNTSKQCPATHQVRTVRNNGIRCERTYEPVLPAAGALAEAWGAVGIAPRSERSETWDGAERACSPQSGGYYVLDTPRAHGLGSGCHTHDPRGGSHHEHARATH